MNRRIVFRHMEKTNHMEEYCIDKLAKIEAFIEKERSPVSVDLILEPSKVHSHHKAELRVNTPYYHKITTYEGPEFYEVLNRVIDTMYIELHKAKDKQKEHERELNRHEDVKKNR